MLETLKNTLALVMTDVDISHITEDTRFTEDLGFDSLNMLMLAMEIENVFGFEFDEFVRFETVGDVCRYIEAHKQKKEKRK